MKNKIFIITGDQESGKSFLTKQMAFNYNKAFWMDGRNYKDDKPFLFHGLKNNCDLIIIDDLKTSEIETVCSRFFNDDMVIEMRGFPLLTIKTPNVIINTQSKVLTKNLGRFDDSFLKRVSFIETNSYLNNDGLRIFEAKKIETKCITPNPK